MLIQQWSGQRSLKYMVGNYNETLRGIELHGMKINDLIKLIC